MALKVVTERQFKHRVRVFTPVDGGHTEESIKVTYRVIDTEAVEGFDLARAEDTTEFLRTVIVHIDDVQDENGAPISYSDDVRDTLLKIPYVRSALGRGYFEGIGKGRKGN